MRLFARLLLAPSLFVPVLAPAATHVVNNAADPAAGAAANCAPGNPGTCTLRDAIAAALGNDRIEFAPQVSTITLGSELVFASTGGTDPVVLDGGGTVTLDGNDATRVLRTVANSTTRIQGVRIRNGNGSGLGDGGCVLNRGSLTLADSDIADCRGNFGGGIFNSGTLALVDSVVSGSEAGLAGGGISNTATLTLMRSEVTGNAAQIAGGVYNNQATMTLADSTLSDNGGGGIWNRLGTLEIVNSTISGNHGGFGIDHYDKYDGSLTMTHSTVAGNALGIDGTAATIVNSIVAGGCEVSQPIDGGGNLDAGASCGFSTAQGSRPNASLELGPLEDNGGRTRTVLPGPRSDAVDFVACGGVALDQRGVARPQGGRCDSGAVEANAVYRVNDSGDPPSGQPSRCAWGNPDTCSLRDAIAAAQGGATILFQPSVSTIVVSNELVFASTSSPDPVTVDGGGTVILDGGEATRLLRTAPGSVTGLRGLVLRNGRVPAGDRGAGILNDGALSLDAVTVSASRTGSNGFGGGIWNGSLGALVVRASTLSGNEAALGGALYNLGDATVAHATLAYNQATQGGAIHQGGGSLSLAGSTLSQNAAVDGADVRIEAGHAEFVASIIGSGCAGTPDDGGGNLDAGTSCGFDAATSTSNARLELGAFQDNGGPAWTFLPGVGSDAIDSADCAGLLPMDQRGLERPQGVRCDSGAVEVRQHALTVSILGAGRVSAPDLPQLASGEISDCTTACTANYLGEGDGAPPVVVLTATADEGYVFAGWAGDCSSSGETAQIAMDQAHACTAAFALASITVNNGADPDAGAVSNCAPGNAGTCTLRDALATAHGGSTIAFAPDVTTITLTRALVFSSVSNADPVVLDGGGVVTIDGNHATRLFRTVEGSVTEMRNLAMRNGYAASGAAGISNFGTLTLVDCIVSDSSTGANAGGIYNQGPGTLALVRSAVSDNSASNGGGVVNEGRMTAIDSVLSGNHANLSGGGLFNMRGSIELSRSTLSDNQAASGGGLYNGLFSGSSEAVLRNVTLSDNVATGRGGGILNEASGTLVMTQVTSSHNSANNGGAGLYKLGGSVAFAGTIIDDGCLGTPGDLGGNLDAGTSCNFSQPDSASNAILDLGMLQDNGGTTLTRMPGAASDAIDFANCDGAPETDQRGMTRPDPFAASPTACDAGAVEANSGYVLDVEVVGNGRVSAAAAPAPLGGGGIADCDAAGGPDCVAVYADGDGVALVATPDPEFRLIWGGDCDDADGMTAVVTMDAARSCTATFGPDSVLALGIDDGTEHVGYGQTLAYLVTLGNYGDGGAADVSLHGSVANGPLDAALQRWCATVDGLTCSAAVEEGPFGIDAVDVAANDAVRWIVFLTLPATWSAPVIEYQVEASGAATVGDIDTVVLFRDGFER